jgi:hypothetical protein
MINMKKTFWILSLFLLFFTSVSAIYGGMSLISDPSGGMLKIPPEWLERIPFRDYLIPGIILFVFNGMFSLVIFILTLMRYRHYALLVVFQGCTLFIWIVVQVIMFQALFFLHWICGGIGILLIISGWILYSRKQ